MPSSGEMSLTTLISSMSPIPDPSNETYVFGHIPATSEADFTNILKLFSGLSTQMLFREAEGWTAIVPQHVADEIGLKYEFPCKKITLNVHSSLDAVGFIAAVGKMLAEMGVGVNPVSGFYHDHLFIPVGREGEVVEALREMAEEAGREGA